MAPSRSGRRGRAILALYPGIGSLVALVVLDGPQVAEALALRRTPATRTFIERTPRVKEGRWVFVPVSGAAVARDVRRLVRIRPT